MIGDMTRRDLAAGLFGSASLAAQTGSGEAAALFEEGRAELRGNLEEMKKVELDLNTQPAFVFKP